MLAAVVKNRFELIVVGAARVEFGVEDESGSRLLLTPGHMFGSFVR